MPLKPMLMLLLCATLAACKTAPTPSIAQSLAPVHTLIPTVECGEDKPDAQLPDYPAAGFSVTNDLSTLPLKTRDELIAIAGGAENYSKAQQQWAVRAVGVVEDEHTLRRNTYQCLNGLRARGLIN